MTRTLIDSEGDEVTDWRLVVRESDATGDAIVEASRRIEYDGTLRFSTDSRGNSVRKNSQFGLDVGTVVDFYHKRADTDADKERLVARATRVRDSLQRPARHEPADFGGGESTGVQDL